METLVEQKQSIKLETRTKLEFNHLKDLIQHSYKNRGFQGICYVTPSRFRKILSDYYSLNCIHVDGALDNYANFYDFYTLSELDKEDRGNSYKIVKDSGTKEIKGKCEKCDCGTKRFLNPETGTCYYKEMIQTNYTNKLK